MAAAKVKTKVRQAQITQAARDILAKGGFGELTISAIAKRVGMADSNVYRHFKNKEAVVEAIIADTKSSLMGMLREVCQEEKGASARLEKIFFNHVRFMEKHGDLPVMLFSCKFLGHADGMLEKISEGIKGYMEAVKRILEQGVKDGEFARDLDIETAAVTFIGFVQFLVLQRMILGFPMSPSQRGKKVWPIYLKGISRRA
jgi:AcrR family transcriptional regulator